MIPPQSPRLSAALSSVGPVSPVDLVRSWTQALADKLECADNAERVELLRALEQLKCAAEAAQARTAVGLDSSVRANEAAAGIRPERRGRGVAGQVGLARRCSPHKARQLVGLAKIVESELPCTAAAWRVGRISEWRVMLIARASVAVPVEVRRRIDREVAGDARRLERLSDRQTAAEVARWAGLLDPAAVAAGRRYAESQRRVSVRPAPDAMTWLTALLPVAEGVAVQAALVKAADAARAAGDKRSRGQVMADELVERVTGRGTGGHDITINLVITDRALFGSSNEPARIPGHGSIPASQARDLVTATLSHDARGRGGGSVESESERAPRVWIRRLFTDPVGQLVAMESAARRAPRGLAEFITVRDQTCRTPWCDAPIRHIDHIVPAADGGVTTAANGQGLCEACNYTKSAPGWRARPLDGWAAATITPTGYAYITEPTPWPTPRSTSRPAGRTLVPRPARPRRPVYFDPPHPLSRLHPRPHSHALNDSSWDTS